jgi:ankyrin repeat protein
MIIEDLDTIVFFHSLQSPDLVDYLLSHGADVNAEDVQRKTALHYAVQGGQDFYEKEIETIGVLCTNSMLKVLN